MTPGSISISLWRVYFSIGHVCGSWFGDRSIGLALGKRKQHLACQTIRWSRIMSARIEPSREFVILTATLSLRYALGILFLCRVLYVFKGLTPTCAAVSLPL